MEGFKKHIKETRLSDKDRIVSVIGYIPLSKVPGKFVRFQYSYIFNKFLRKDEDDLLKSAFKEALNIHFLHEATGLDLMLNIEDIDLNNLIFNNNQFASMVDFIYNK